LLVVLLADLFFLSFVQFLFIIIIIFFKIRMIDFVVLINFLNLWRTLRTGSLHIHDSIPLKRLSYFLRWKMIPLFLKINYWLFILLQINIELILLLRYQYFLLIWLILNIFIWKYTDLTIFMFFKLLYCWVILY